MKRALLLSLFLGHAFADVPSNIKRTEIELEKDGIDMHRAPISLQLGAGSSSSTFNPGSYGFKDGKLSAGAKFILGTVDRDGAAGFAIAPDLKVQFRLDNSGKKLRLEAGGKLISAYDLQFVFSEVMSKAEIKVLENEIASFKDEAKDKNYEKSLEFSERDLETIKRNIIYYNDKIKSQPKDDLGNLERERLREKLEEQEISRRKREEEIKETKNSLAIIQGEIKKRQDILAADLEKSKNPKRAYATIDLSLLNLGGEYKEVADAFYKFAGAKGSAVTLSFDLAAKNKGGSVRVGLCGVADILTATAGRNETKDGIFNHPTLGVGGSLCARFGVGPVMLTNTFGGHIQGNDYFKTASINNNARLGVKTGIIPGVITEFGAFHNYSKEWYPGGEIDSHMVGGGITVLAK